MSDLLFIRDLILARAGDPVDGYNPMVLAAAAALGLPEPSSMKIDFSGASSQLILGEIHPGDLDKTTAIKYPQFHCWVDDAKDEQQNMGGEFSGQVTAGIRIGVSWRQTSAMGLDFEGYPRAVISAMGTAFNRQMHRGWSLPATAQAYNWKRSPIERSGEHWRQWIIFTMPFLVDV